MTNVLILGANGSIARIAIREFLDATDAHLTLYLRNPRRLKLTASARLRTIEGDVLDSVKLTAAMSGVDVVPVGDVHGPLISDLRSDPEPARSVRSLALCLALSAVAQYGALSCC